MKRFFQFVFIFLLGLLTACVNVEGVYQDPSFTFNSMVSNNIGIGGVGSSVTNLLPGDQNAYANILRNSLIEHYTGLDVMPAGDVVRALGTVQYRNMLSYYQHYGVIPDQYLENMKIHIHHMRYLVFARITQDEVTNSYDESDSMDKGMVDVNYKTNLNMQLDLAVYDLELKRLVFSATSSDSDTNSQTYSIPKMSTNPHEDTTKAIVQDVASYLTRDQVEEHHSYPPAPSRLSLLKNMFDAIVNKFPKSEKD